MAGVVPVPAYSGEKAECRWCGEVAAADAVCPWSVACPQCHARPGSRCRRPSGHPAAAIHRARWEASEALDRAALGVQGRLFGQIMPISGEMELAQLGLGIDRQSRTAGAAAAEALVGQPGGDVAR